MRKLTKGPKPQILIQREQEWTAELVNALAAGQTPTDTAKTRYRHPQIKAALIEETHAKCAYCESKVRHITPGDIEHIVPKSKVPLKSFLWENLTLACDVCNGNKGDEYSNDPQNNQDALIDPYVDDPQDHFLFMREIVSPRPDSLRAIATEDVIRLARNDLVEKRRERMNFLDGLVLAHSLADASYKALLKKNLEEKHLKKEDEYFVSSSAYIAHLKSKGML